MGKLFKIRIIEEHIKSFSLEPTYFELKFKKINLENFEGKKFEKKFEREDSFRENNIFQKYMKTLNELEGRNYIFLMKPDGTNFLIRTIEEVEILKDGTKIYFDKIKEIETSKIPSFLKITKNTKIVRFSKVKSKSISEIENLLNALIEETSLESFQDYYISGNRQATASQKGYLEQSYMAHYFLFKNNKYKKINSIKIEGKLEDIEIEYRTDKKDYIQVKICETPQNEITFNKTRFKSGIEGLKSTHSLTENLKMNTNKFIYASNTIKQPIERLTNLLILGHEVNQENSWVDFSSEEQSEILKITGKLDTSLKENFELVRVSPKMLKVTPTEFFYEFEQLNHNLGTSNNKLEIYQDLPNLFIENSVTREAEIGIKEIAYKFFRKRKSDDTWYYVKFLDNIFSPVKNIFYNREVISSLISSGFFSCYTNLRYIL